MIVCKIQGTLYKPYPYKHTYNNEVGNETQQRKEKIIVLFLQLFPF